MFLNITVLILIILILIVYNQNKENFNVLQTTNDCNTNPYDPKCLLLNVTKQSNDTVSGVAKVLDTPVLEPFENDTDINTADLTILVDKCEKTLIPKDQCNVFDDTFFATNCGISFDPNGKDHNDNPHQGGLYINDKTSRAPFTYQPTSGKAAFGTFAITKDNCNIVKEKVDCENLKSVTSKNCNQCYFTKEYIRVDPGNKKLPSTIFLYGQGAIDISGDSTLQSNLNSSTPVDIKIPSTGEGSVFKIKVTGNEPYIFGFLQSNTLTLDIINLITDDSDDYEIDETKSFKGINLSQIIPQDTDIIFNIMIPFSFLQTGDVNSQPCNGPVLTMEDSIQFLQSDPCFDGVSLECIQDRWLHLGGTRSGKGFPKDEIALTTILSKYGSDIDTLTRNLSIEMKKAKTGLYNGKSLDISTWNTISMWATGEARDTPCDGSGPLSKECLSYLYLNKGAGKRIKSTYNTTGANCKIPENSNIQYCKTGTSLDPTTEDGFNIIKNYKTIADVKNIYNLVYESANAPGPINNFKKYAMDLCYGVNVTPTPMPNGVFIGVNTSIEYSETSTQSILNSKWNNISGSVNSISLAPNGALFGTNRVSGIYYMSNYKAGNWIQLSGGLKQIHTNGTTIVGTNTNNEAFYLDIKQIDGFYKNYYSSYIQNLNFYNGLSSFNKMFRKTPQPPPNPNIINISWSRIPLLVKKAVVSNSVLSNFIYAIGTDDNIYRTYYTSGWSNVFTGKFTDIAVDDIIVLIQHNQIYYSTAHNIPYVLIPNQPAEFKSISVSNGSIYAIATNNTPWYLSNYKNGKFVQIQRSQQFASHRVTNP